MISKEWNSMDTYLFEASYYGVNEKIFLKRWPLKKGERDAIHKGTHTHTGTLTNNNRTNMTNWIQALSNQREWRNKWMDRVTENKELEHSPKLLVTYRVPMINIARLFLADCLIYTLSGREIWWDNLISWINQTNDVISKKHNKP